MMLTPNVFLVLPFSARRKSRQQDAHAHHYLKERADLVALPGGSEQRHAMHKTVDTPIEMGSTARRAVQIPKSGFCCISQQRSRHATVIDAESRLNLHRLKLSALPASYFQHSNGRGRQNGIIQAG
jgi:hypothetical protein